MKLLTKLLIAAGLLALPVLTEAASPVRYVQISTSPLSQQTGAINIASGTVTNLRTNSATILGGLTVNATSSFSAALTQSGGAVTVSSITAPALIVNDGAIGVPGVRFANETGSGLRRGGTANVNVMANGVTSSSFTSAGVSLLGTNTNDSAATGWVGEFISSRTVAIGTPGSGAFGDLLSIPLTAGDWDISAALFYDANGSTWSTVNIGISTTTGNSTAGLFLGDNRLTFIWAQSVTTPLFVSMTIPEFRVSNTAPFTYYLKYATSQSAGTPTAAGRISARRRR